MPGRGAESINILWEGKDIPQKKGLKQRRRGGRCGTGKRVREWGTFPLAGLPYSANNSSYHLFEDLVCSKLFNRWSQ